MNCEQSNNLFDCHLDGELSPVLETELLAHLVECAACRRSMAILEVAGQVLKSDDRQPALSDTFSDRLLACMDDEPSTSYLRFRKAVRWSLVGLGAAAAVTFAVGAFSGKRPVVAGSHEVVEASDVIAVDSRSDHRPARQEGHLAASNSEKWESVEASKDKPALTLDDWSRMSIMQLLDALGLEDHDAEADVLPLESATEAGLHEMPEWGELEDF